jgi:shikimate dehydrogenase
MITDASDSLSARVPTGATQVYGIIGWPVLHSLSPAMQTTAFEMLGIDALYVAFPVRPGATADAMAGLFAAGVRGLNVTAPLKEEAAHHCTRCSAAAERAASVNTLVRTDSGWYGETTDGDGFVAWLESVRYAIRDSRFVILGAGGAARSIAVSLLDHGAARVKLVVRNVNRATTACNQLLQGSQGRVVIVGLDALTPPTRREPNHYLVNSLPPEALTRDALGDLLARVAPRIAVVDLSYTHESPPLLELARERGVRGWNGLGLLHHQGALSLGRWLGIAPPFAIVADALKGALTTRVMR